MQRVPRMRARTGAGTMSSASLPCGEALELGSVMQAGVVAGNDVEKRERLRWEASAESVLSPSAHTASAPACSRMPAAVRAPRSTDRSRTGASTDVACRASGAAETAGAPRPSARRAASCRATRRGGHTPASRSRAGDVGRTRGCRAIGCPRALAPRRARRSAAGAPDTIDAAASSDRGRRVRTVAVTGPGESPARPSVTGHERGGAPRPHPGSISTQGTCAACCIRLAAQA